MLRILFTCGGTGGHINPALAVAKMARARHPEGEFCFVGAEGGMETKLVPKEGFPLKTLDAHSFRRGFTPADLYKNARTAVGLTQVLGQAKKIVQEFRPSVVVGTGGYASFPTVYAAQQLKIPTVIHESNAVPGLTTKMLARSADRILVSFEDSVQNYPRKEAVVVTGTPVREEFVYATREQARRELKLDARPLVVTCFGSLGAREMNKKIAEFIRLESTREDFYHIHACGSYGWRWMPKLVQDLGVDLTRHPEVDMREYIYDMPRLMAAADLMICRAGASTLSELCVAAKPAVIVPSPNVAGNHQEKNARVLERRGAAQVVLEKECDGQSLYGLVCALLADGPRRQEMTRALRDMAILDATERIYQTILDVAK